MSEDRVHVIFIHGEGFVQRVIKVGSGQRSFQIVQSHENASRFTAEETALFEQSFELLVSIFQGNFRFETIDDFFDKLKTIDLSIKHYTNLDHISEQIEAFQAEKDGIASRLEVIEKKLENLREIKSTMT